MIQPENPRFTNVYLDRRNSHSILKDNETGVLYFMVRPGGDAGIGLTPLVGPDGKPIVDPVE